MLFSHDQVFQVPSDGTEEKRRSWTNWSVTDLSTLWVVGIRTVLSLLILTILLALALGVVRTTLDLRLFWDTPIETGLRHVLLSTLLLLALVEVFKTTVTYFTEGRVKVTFIVDTILVVMLTEIISEWFKGETLLNWMILGTIILILGAMRIVAVKFSPAKTDPPSDSWGAKTT
jgi:uncharacterized membrane protein (DUF373 family)